MSLSVPVFYTTKDLNRHFSKEDCGWPFVGQLRRGAIGTIDEA